MITDRKKFHFKYPGCRVKRVQWVRRGEQRTADRPNNPMCVNMYAGITCYGVTKAHLVTGTSKMTTNFKNQERAEVKEHHQRGVSRGADAHVAARGA